MLTVINRSSALVVAMLLALSLQCVAATDVGSNRVCFGDTTTLVNLSTVAHSALVQWDIDNDGFFNDATGDTVKKVFTVSNTFTVRIKVTDSTGAVFYSAAHQVIVDPIPQPAFDWIGRCQNQSIRFINASTVADASTLTYQWDFLGNGSTDATTADASHAYATTGSYFVKLKVGSSAGCSASVIDTVTVFANPHADFATANSSPCANTDVLFRNTTTFSAGAINNSVWNFGDSTLGFGNDSTTHAFLVGNTYHVRLKVTDVNGCIDSTSKNVEIFNTVTDTITLSNGATIEDGKETAIAVTGDFATFEWQDGSTDNPRAVRDSGIYTFTVANTAGCSRMDSVQISLLEVPDKTVSGNDILTPNGDGKNDLLVFKNIAHFTACKLDVYDQKGAKVYSSDNYQNDWDGKRSGTELNAGAYYYILKCDSETEIKAGTNIIR